MIAIMGNCAMAPTALYLLRLPTSGRKQAAYIHKGSALTTIHTMDEPGVHHFIVTVDPDEATTFANTHLHLNHQPAPATAEVEITDALFDKIILAVHEDHVAEGLALLKDAGYTEATAQPFVDSVKGMQANSLAAIVSIHDDAPTTTSGLSLLEGPSGFWLLSRQPAGDTPAPMTATPIAADDCAQRIAAMLQGDNHASA